MNKKRKFFLVHPEKQGFIFSLQLQIIVWCFFGDLHVMGMAFTQ